MFPSNLEPGATVRISESDGYRCVGIVKSIERRGERRLLRVKNCRSIDSGVVETGDQFFSEDKVMNVEVVSSSSESRTSITGGMRLKAKQDQNGYWGQRRCTRHEHVQGASDVQGTSQVGGV